MSRQESDDPGIAETQVATAEAAPTARAEDRDALAKTITSGQAMTPPRQVEALATPIREGGHEDRYRTERVLGRGGMGEVDLCSDERIGRRVAIKSLRRGSSASAETVARFLREGRVQAQLEHPAIVPVYDLGARADGTPYFTMRRLTGLTLEEILVSRRSGDTESEHSDRKLLSDFATVCQAVDYAHQHGVVHRDLKPSNIMLGSFGEVYVLDWGVAKVAGGEGAGATDGGEDRDSIRSGDTDTQDTAYGAVIGTPGYMAPEQVRGEIDRIDARADVYALGATLFEILTLQPLHERAGGTQAILDATLAGADARCSRRVPEIHVALELEDICVRATALDPAERFGSARALVQALQRYLDGDRDLARRRELAQAHAGSAAAALARALGHGDEGNRREALRQAGRALALDPDNSNAAHIMTRMMLEPPKIMPAEVVEQIDASQQAASRMEARNGVFAYLGGLSTAPFFLWMGVRDWWVLGPLMALALLLAGLAFTVSRKRHISSGDVLIATIANALLLGYLSRLFGPFILLPGIAALVTIGFVYHIKLQRPLITITVGCAAVLTPFLLELGGVLASSYEFRDGAMVVVPNAVNLPRLPTLLALGISCATIVIYAAVFVGSMRAAQVEAQNHLFLQAWQLRQLIPEQTQEALGSPSSPTSGPPVGGAFGD